MIRHFLSVFCLAATTVLTLPVFADEANVPAGDLANAKDHPAIKRYEGSKIFAYSHQDYAPYQPALGKGLNPAAAASYRKSIEKEEALEGKLTRISYIAPAGRSSLEVFRNYQNDLNGSWSRFPHRNILLASPEAGDRGKSLRFKAHRRS